MSRYQSGKENRLAALSDNGYVSNYLYDAAGERTVKMHGGSEGVMVNGRQAAARLGAVDFTAYVSPYLVVSPGGNYTKHIYAGSQSITSKLANGTINAESEPKAGGNNGIYDTKTSLIQAALKTEYDSLGVKYGEISSTFAGSGTNSGNLVYFYHPDHLGSSSLITGSSGEALQHIEYVPYGEVFIEEKNATWCTPYKFNAKELDEETGLYYYGARYYDPKTSVWISVDPLAEKRSNISSYVYCTQNPVKYVDPDGRDWIENRETNKVEWAKGVTSKKNTPDGYIYRGTDGYDINEESGNITFYNNDGTISEGIQALSAIECTPNGSREDENFWAELKNPSLSKNNKSGYVWDEKDLKVWNQLKNGSDPISRYVRSKVATGDYPILSNENFYDIYGDTACNLWFFSELMDMANNLADPSPAVNVPYFKFNINRKGLSSKKPTFNQYRATHSFKGVSGRGMSTKAAWKAYKAIYGNNAVLFIK